MSKLSFKKDIQEFERNGGSMSFTFGETKLPVIYREALSLLYVKMPTTEVFIQVDYRLDFSDNANMLMEKLLQNYLNDLGKASIDELKQIDGIGDFIACRLMAAIELGKRRLLESAKLCSDVSSATAVYNIMHPQMMDLDHEEAHVLLLNNNYKLIKQVRLSQGGITETAVDIRVIMKNALLNNATVIVLVHNHPSNNVMPSRDDDRLTENVKKACETMRIFFSDHVIITDGNYYSYRERGKL